MIADDGNACAIDGSTVTTAGFVIPGDIRAAETTASTEVAADRPPVAFNAFGFGVTQTEVTLLTTLAGILALAVYRFRNRHNKHGNTQRNTH